MAALAFIRHGFPLVVEARVAESDCALGIEVSMAVANGMEAENRVGDVGWIFIVLEHVRFNPYVPVGVGGLPGSASVDPDAKVFGSVDIAGIYAGGKGSLVVVDDRFAVAVECAWKAQEYVGDGVGGALCRGGVLAVRLRDATVHDGHNDTFGVDLNNGPGCTCKEFVVYLAWGDGGAVIVHAPGELPSSSLLHRDALEW